MKKYIVLIPIYNDRESLTKLIEDINSEIEGYQFRNFNYCN
jgi:NifB/MoaA-like Fe-S oxidoreductase